MSDIHEGGNNCPVLGAIFSSLWKWTEWTLNN